MMTRADFIKIIELSEQPHHKQLSYMYGSDYYTVNSYSIRISDHAKNENSFGFKSYQNDNDFRSYEDALEYLSKYLDMTDKTEQRKRFYAENESSLVITEDGFFKNPFGTFATVESALNNWYRSTRSLIQTPKESLGDDVPTKRKNPLKR